MRGFYAASTLVFVALVALALWVVSCDHRRSQSLDWIDRSTLELRDPPMPVPLLKVRDDD